MWPHCPVCSAAGLCRPCPWEWELFQGSCYLFSRTLGSWEASVASCQNLGAHLVIVNSFEEQVMGPRLSYHPTHPRRWIPDWRLWGVKMQSEGASCRKNHNGVERST